MFGVQVFDNNSRIVLSSEELPTVSSMSEPLIISGLKGTITYPDAERSSVFMKIEGFVDWDYKVVYGGRTAVVPLLYPYVTRGNYLGGKVTWEHPLNLMPELKTSPQSSLFTKAIYDTFKSVKYRVRLLVTHRQEDDIGGF
jgi:hypothetical protein